MRYTTSFGKQKYTGLLGFITAPFAVAYQALFLVPHAVIVAGTWAAIHFIGKHW